MGLKFDASLIVQNLELVTQMDYDAFCFKKKCFVLQKLTSALELCHVHQGRLVNYVPRCK
jgi:hypothetical protein